jgi:hypothetical protein
LRSIRKFLAKNSLPDRWVLQYPTTINGNSPTVFACRDVDGAVRKPSTSLHAQAP